MTKPAPNGYTAGPFEDTDMFPERPGVKPLPETPHCSECDRPTYLDGLCKLHRDIVTYQNQSRRRNLVREQLAEWGMRNRSGLG